MLMQLLAPQDYVRGTYSVVTSKAAQRTLLNTVLLVIASTILYGFAAVGYILFYHNYLPDQVTTVPVHLQYGLVLSRHIWLFDPANERVGRERMGLTRLRDSYGLNPYGVAFLGDRNLEDLQAYDITVSLTLPRSPANINRGNFMVALHLLSPGSGGAASDSSKPKSVFLLPARHRARRPTPNTLNALAPPPPGPHNPIPMMRNSTMRWSCSHLHARL